MPAEAERIGYACLQDCFSRDIWNVIQITFGISLLLINGWRYDALPQRLNERYRFCSPAAPSICPVMDLFAVTGI